MGAVLLPEVDPVERALKEDGLLLFPLEVGLEVAPSPLSYFAAEQVRQAVAFPRYRIFLYNETDRTVALDLYVYLSR